MKKTVISLVVIIALLFNFLPTFSVSANLIGDVNNDTKITASDARLALRASAKLEVLSEDQKKAADVDFDGSVRASDARKILRAAAKLEVLSTIPDEDISANKIDISSIPSYSGNAYVTINNNKPIFATNELTTIGYEKYSSLDNLGRCGVALASCGKEIMPAPGEERGSISSITPSGWIQAKYSGISGGYLWNRCHLIGWQLSAENANRQNLITGTRYMNIEGMLPFENMVADYIRETNNHVAYRVTPIYNGNNLVCSGVQIEAYSIEDNGEGICFNVFCYNVQPGITINYATGASTGPQETQEPSTTKNNQGENNTTKVDNDNEISNSEMVWVTKTGGKYHSNSSCSRMKNPSHITKAEAVQKGYEPCKKCY